MARSLSHPSNLSWRKRSLPPDSHLHPQDPSILALIIGLLTASKELRLCQKPSLCQRINARNLCRRASSLFPLFEEVRDSGVWIPPSALSSFRDLRSAFRKIKALLHYCRHTSTLQLLMEQDPLASQFQKLSSSIASSLSSLPCDLLEISLETKEHLSLVQSQASQAYPFNDPEEKALQAEVLSVLSSLEAQISPDAEKLSKLFERLNFKDAKDCERELWMLENEREKLRENSQYGEIPNVNSLVSLMRYGRCILYGLGQEKEEAIACRKSELLACASMRKVVLARVDERGDGGDGSIYVPEDFKCPISLELMVDPVAISSGQTYERSSISKWLAEGHTTCPKSGTKLLHSTVIPNSTLRRLISQWCAENDFVLENLDKLPAPRKPDADLPSTKAGIEATRLTADFLVEKLSHATGSSDVERQATYELRLMSKDGSDSRACIGDAGAVPVLAALLNSSNKLTQENAVTALLNLSLDEKNKDLIMKTDGALDKIVGVLAEDTDATLAAKENAVAALHSISTAKVYRGEVGTRSAAIDALLQMLRRSSPRGTRDAALTLFYVALDDKNLPVLLQKGAELAAIEALEREGSEHMADDLVALLAVLARRPDGLAAVSAGIGRVVEPLVQVMAEGSSKAKEYTTVLLLGACALPEAEATSASLRLRLRSARSLFPSLRRLIAGGTPRAQRKAASLFKLLQPYPSSFEPSLM